ncbi:MAG: histidinol-phosphate transaminase [Magnetococcales bacterium]|nr:histidinol-phosphate transaminase [Magnetococcales bacterium]
MPKINCSEEKAKPMNRPNPARIDIQKMSGYTPGEQPDPSRPLTKLNTNENPFPPPKAVLDAILSATKQNLRLYPEPSSISVRQAAAKAYNLKPEQVIAGNGSDDLLTMVLRTFVGHKQLVTAPAPTYSLYETLTKIQGGIFKDTPWPDDFSLPIDDLIKSNAQLIFVVRPNAPTGHVVPLADIAKLCENAPGVVVLDEAYVDFAEDNGLSLLNDHDNLIITRTMSKSLGLAGLRVGLGFTNPTLAAEMHKVRDSYNLNRLSQAGAVAALDNLAAYKPGIAAIRNERSRVTIELQNRGFTVMDSQANFILATVPKDTLNGEGWLNALRNKGYLIRYFGSDPRLADKIRITIGTKDEMDGFLQAVDELL